MHQLIPFIDETLPSTSGQHRRRQGEQPEEEPEMPPMGQAVSCIYCDDSDDSDRAIERMVIKLCNCVELVHMSCYIRVHDKKRLKCSHCGLAYSQATERIRRLRRCALCKVRQLPANGDINEMRFIKPCFCETTYHHKCLCDALESMNYRCEVCGVVFRYKKYGSYYDFCCLFRCQYMLSTAFITSCYVLGVFSFAHIHDGMWYTQFMSIVAGVISFTLGIITQIYTIYHMVFHRYPRFLQRHQTVTVVDFDPDAKDDKIRRKDLATREVNLPLCEMEEMDELVDVVGFFRTLPQSHTFSTSSSSELPAMTSSRPATGSSRNSAQPTENSNEETRL